jgi:very-short-patch-repair endonuclease
LGIDVVSAFRVCARLAGRQKGVVKRAQLLAAGLTPGVISHLIREGYLHPIYRGVYAVGHRALPQYATEQAALLACGETSVLSGESALYLWGILKNAPGEVDVTIPGPCRRKRAGIRLHRAAGIARSELRTRHGLALVYPARALIDYAATASFEELGDAVAETRDRGLIRDGELEAAARAAGRRRGACQMRAFLRHEGEPEITRSRAERHFRRLLKEAELPQPRLNAPVAGLRVDFLWKAEKVVLEVDGWRFHGGRRAFENDRKRDRILSDAGYHVIRVTWKHFTEEALALIAHVARMLDRRSRSPH